MNVVQLIALIVSIGLFAWVLTSFILSLVRRNREKNRPASGGDPEEEGGNKPQ